MFDLLHREANPIPPYKPFFHSFITTQLPCNGRSRFLVYVCKINFEFVQKLCTICRYEKGNLA